MFKLTKTMTVCAMTVSLTSCAGLQAILPTAPDTVGGYSYQEMEELGYLDLEPGSCRELQIMKKNKTRDSAPEMSKKVRRCELAIKEEKERKETEAAQQRARQEEIDRLNAKAAEEQARARREAEAREQRRADAMEQAEENIAKRVAATKASKALEPKAGKRIMPSPRIDIGVELVQAVACIEIEYQAEDVSYSETGGNDFKVKLENAITNSGRRDITLNVVDAGDRYLLASYSTGGFAVTNPRLKAALIGTTGRGQCSRLVEFQKLLGVSESDYSSLIPEPIL